ncbi:unnamed protein product [Gulo gulo]|uniref:Uncharacterized protein n=1 Tax=Gulo gulo TaxID=48420 RepID=A0A9X9M0H5_GULGU|nr:unnamed protein product [Gulo gulo]
MLSLWEPQPKKRRTDSGRRTLFKPSSVSPYHCLHCGSSHSDVCLPPWYCCGPGCNGLFLACQPCWSLGTLSLVWKV